MQVLQRLGLAFTWASYSGMQAYISWLPAIASAVAVEPVLASAGINAAVTVAVVPLVVLCVLFVATAWCSLGMDVAARAHLPKSGFGTILWRGLGASTSWLFIPLLAMLTSVYSCGSPTFDPWSAAGNTCWTGVHLVLTITNSSAAAMLIAGGVFYNAAIAASPLRSTSRTARAHGRADAGACLVDALLVLVLCASRGWIAPMASAGIALGGAAAWLGLSVFFMPFIRPILNFAMATAMSGTAWVAACGLMVHFDKHFSLSQFLVVGLLPSIVCGYGLSVQRWRSVGLTTTAATSSVYSFEVKVRARCYWSRPAHTFCCAHTYCLLVFELLRICNYILLPPLPNDGCMPC